MKDAVLVCGSPKDCRCQWPAGARHLLQLAMLRASQPQHIHD